MQWEWKDMKLVYKGTSQEVKVGDQIVTDDAVFTVEHFTKPHKPASSGKVTVKLGDKFNKLVRAEFYVSVIGAEWIEREDRE
jgi:hypothetical protein